MKFKFWCGTGSIGGTPVNYEDAEEFCLLLMGAGKETAPAVPNVEPEPEKLAPRRPILIGALERRGFISGLCNQDDFTKVIPSFEKTLRGACFELTGSFDRLTT